MTGMGAGVKDTGAFACGEGDGDGDGDGDGAVRLYIFCIV